MVEIVEGIEAEAEPEVVAGLKEVTNTPEALPTTDNVEIKYSAFVRK